MKTKAPEWVSKLEELDKAVFGYVKLNCDGYTVSFQNMVSKRRILTAWYVDGIYKGEYSNKDNPIGAKFGQPYTIKRNARQIKIIRLLNGTKAANAAKNEVVLIGYRNYWNSSKALITHLKKTCKEIQTVE